MGKYAHRLGPWTRRHWPLVMATAVLLLLLVGVVQSFRGLLVASYGLEHTTEVELATSRLLVDLVNAETGQRGFLASGDPRFLDIYDSGLSSWPADFDLVQGQTADNTAQQRRLASIKTLIDRKLDEMNVTMTVYRRGAPDRALATAMMSGKEVMDRIRGLIDDMQREEHALAIVRQRSKVVQAERVLALSLVSAFGFVALVAVWWTMRQRERRRLGEQFVAVLGHDLRSPLNAITMAASMLGRSAAGDEKLTNRIVSSAARMNKMIAEILDLARSRLGAGIPIERRRVTLNDVVESVVDEVRQAYPSREIRVHAALEVQGDWDAARLEQVVSNLVCNAVQYGDAARPVEVRVAMRVREAVLEVQSFGQPIPRDLLPVLFEPYRRGELRGRAGHGLGLGLFIADQIVRSHGGRIEVSSRSEGGTMFRVRLPGSAPAHLGLSLIRHVLIGHASLRATKSSR
jgi:signal transduction histidine kinase